MGLVPSPHCSVHWTPLSPEPPFSPRSPPHRSWRSSPCLTPCTRPVVTRTGAPWVGHPVGKTLDAFLWESKQEPCLSQPCCPSYSFTEGKSFPSFIASIHLILLSLNTSGLDSVHSILLAPGITFPTGVKGTGSVPTQAS